MFVCHKIKCDSGLTVTILLCKVLFEIYSSLQRKSQLAVRGLLCGEWPISSHYQQHLQQRKGDVCFKMDPKDKREVIMLSGHPYL